MIDKEKIKTCSALSYIVYVLTEIIVRLFEKDFMGCKEK